MPRGVTEGNNYTSDGVGGVVLREAVMRAFDSGHFFLRVGFSATKRRKQPCNWNRELKEASALTPNNKRIPR
jgi:hypothetical protein